MKLATRQCPNPQETAEHARRLIREAGYGDVRNNVVADYDNGWPVIGPIDAIPDEVIHRVYVEIGYPDTPRHFDDWLEVRKLVYPL